MEGGWGWELSVFKSYDVVECRDLEWKWTQQDGWSLVGLVGEDAEGPRACSKAEIDRLETEHGSEDPSISDLESEGTEGTEGSDYCPALSRDPWVLGYAAGFAAGRASGLEEGQSMALVEAFVRGLSLAGDAPQASSGGQASAASDAQSGSCPSWFKQGPKIWAGLSVDEKKALRKVNFASEG